MPGGRPAVGTSRRRPGSTVQLFRTARALAPGRPHRLSIRTAQALAPGRPTNAERDIAPVSTDLASVEVNALDPMPRWRQARHAWS